jgi:hypothetical protein
MAETWPGTGGRRQRLWRRPKLHEQPGSVDLDRPVARAADSLVK